MCLLQFQKEYLKTDLHDAAMVLIGFAQNAMNMFKYSFCEKYILLKKVCKEVNSTFSLIFVICAFHYLKSTSVLMLLRLICTSLISIQPFLQGNLKSPWFNSKLVHLRYHGSEFICSTFICHDQSSQMRQEGQGLISN